MVHDNLERLILSQEQADALCVLVAQKLDVANTSLLPLLGRNIEAVKLAPPITDDVTMVENGDKEMGSYCFHRTSSCSSPLSTLTS